MQKVECGIQNVEMFSEWLALYGRTAVYYSNIIRLNDHSPTSSQYRLDGCRVRTSSGDESPSC